MTGGQLFDRILDAANKANTADCYTEETMRQWFCPLIDAIRVLHRAGLQHRDVKPEVFDDLGIVGRVLNADGCRM